MWSVCHWTVAEIKIIIKIMFKLRRRLRTFYIYTYIKYWLDLSFLASKRYLDLTEIWWSTARALENLCRLKSLHKMTLLCFTDVIVTL